MDHVAGKLEILSKEEDGRGKAEARPFELCFSLSNRSQSQVPVTWLDKQPHGDRSWGGFQTMSKEA